MTPTKPNDNASAATTAQLTEPQEKVILRALKRKAPHYVCPTPGLYANAQTLLLEALRRKGLITSSGSPTLTADGILLAESLVEQKRSTQPEHVAATTAQTDTKAAHTPGPWHVGGEWPQCFAVYSEDCLYLAHSNTGIQESGPAIPGREVAKANARLIAAAPTMLEALNEVVYWLSYHTEKSTNVAAAVDAARAAIAKATGK